MDYVVVQKEAAGPSVDQLRRALKPVKRLTDLDALRLAGQATGLLVKNLSIEEAMLVQRVLQAEGVPAEAVPAGQLPKLPDARFVRRLELQPQGLQVYDPLGRPVSVPWPQVALIAAGAIRHFGISQTVTQEWVHRDYILVAYDAVETDVRHHVHDTVNVVVDIVLTGGVMRFQIEAENFQYGYVFNRPELNLSEKAGLLVQLLAEHAPHASLSRGAVALRDHPNQPSLYPSKAALEDETIWSLWRLSACGKG